MFQLKGNKMQLLFVKKENHKWKLTLELSQCRVQQIYKQCSKGQGFSEGPKSGHKCRLLKDKRKKTKRVIELKK